METRTVVIKEMDDGKVIIELYDRHKRLIGVNAALNMDSAVSVLRLLMGSQIVVKEAA